MELFRSSDPEYNNLYGYLPESQEDLIKYLETSLDIDKDKLQVEEDRIKEIKWHDKEWEFFLVPKGSPRPRSDGSHFYVKGAGKMKKLFRKFLRDENIICTRCEFYLTTYQPTPVGSMTKNEIILAEKGLIRPMSTPDFDNLAKTYTDPLQGLILLNDNIISDGCVEKYYSIKPRIKIHLRYQDSFDSKFNERKTINSVSYKKIYQS